MYLSFNGFVRAIEYNKGGTRTEIKNLYEGGAKNSNASGFGRSINGITNNTFVGFYTGADGL